jgi:hypothetical protein
MTIFKKEELERMNGSELSALCVKISESNSATSVEADQARALVNEWKVLMGTATPPARSSQAQQDIQAEIGKMNRKMVAFLHAVGLTN